MYTNIGLTQHVKNALAANTKYMWGGIYRPITENYIQQLYKIYGSSQYSESRLKLLRSYIGKNYFGIDCVGLIKSYYWSGKANGGSGSPNYGKVAGYPDVNANVMYANAKVKGRINTIPEIPGLIVYCKTYPHVGVYIGNGYVIESTLGTRGDGVVKTKLKDWCWEYWFQCPYISYDTITETVKRVKLKYPAQARKGPSAKTAGCGRLVPGMSVTVVIGSETIDETEGYVYIKIKRNGGYQWIVKSALGKF